MGERADPIGLNFDRDFGSKTLQKSVINVPVSVTV
jgi:hypothetical protein